MSKLGRFGLLAVLALPFALYSANEAAKSPNIAREVMARRAPPLHATISAGLDLADAGRLIHVATAHAAVVSAAREQPLD